MKSLKQLTRPNIWRLQPYSCARTEFSGMNASVYLDANENPFNDPLNRYPDPLQTQLKSVIASIKGVPVEQIFLGNGSDEAIDLLYRCFVNPEKDNVVAIEPTYGMYKVCADINNVEYRTEPLREDFSLSADKLLSHCDENTKLIWLCSPNNPTGNCLQESEVEHILTLFDGLVVVDEAYSDFSTNSPWRRRLQEFPNLVVLNTLSKAWGLAAIRLGMAFASKEIVDIMNKVKYPYNVPLPTQIAAMSNLKETLQVENWVKIILLERHRVMEAFTLLPFVERIYRTDANFFLVKVNDAQHIYDYLVSKGIVVRNRNKVRLCEGCLRITIGNKKENNELLAALRQYQ